MKKGLSVLLALTFVLTMTQPALFSASAEQNNGISYALAKVAVTSVKVSPTVLKLAVSKSGVLTSAITPSNATNKAVSWKSSNTKIATVDTAGKVKAVSIGSATITCTAKDGSGKKATCAITVGKLVTSVKLNMASLKLAVGKTGTLIPTIAPSNAIIKSVSWSSSNTKVASVDTAGKVKALGVGTATITCTAKDGSGKKATCTITVGKPVTSIKLIPTSLILDINKTGTLKPVIAPVDATIKNVDWLSSNINVATVDSTGNVKAVGIGTATITCSAKDYSGKKVTCIITVSDFTEIVNTYNNAANATKAYQDSITVSMHEVNSATITKLSVESVRGIAQGLIDKKMGATDYGPKTFINGVSGQDTLTNILPPEGKPFMSSLTAAGVKTATCTANGTGWDIVIQLNEETVGLLTPPPYHSSCMDIITFSAADIAPFTFDQNKVSFKYSGATITAKVNSNGLLESYSVNEPVYITGTLKVTLILVPISVDAEINALWTQDITFKY